MHKLMIEILSLKHLNYLTMHSRLSTKEACSLQIGLVALHKNLCNSIYQGSGTFLAKGGMKPTYF